MNTLLTITGPSCSGKSTLESKLSETFKTQKIVSFTTRAPRDGEVHGRDYHFMDLDQVMFLREDGMLAEEVKFGGRYYGILGTELESKVSSGHTVAVVEPNGVKQLSQYCKDKGIPHVSLYITNSPLILTARFLKRFKEDLQASPIDYSKRMINMLEVEQTWMFAHNYDMLFTSFDSSNENAIIQQVYSEMVLRASR